LKQLVKDTPRLVQLGVTVGKHLDGQSVFCWIPRIFANEQPLGMKSDSTLLPTHFQLPDRGLQPNELSADEHQ
jgi:hypothetical protein